MNKAYSRINWQNAPSEATALNETNLNKMDSAIDTIDDRVVAHDTRLDNDEYAISQAQGDITTLEGTVSTQGSAITALQNGKVDKINGKGLCDIQEFDTMWNGINTGTWIGRISYKTQSGSSVVRQIYNGVVVDSALDSSSTHPVQNKVVTNALAGKVDKVSGKGLFNFSNMQFYDDTMDGEVIAHIIMHSQNPDPLEPDMEFDFYNGMVAISNAEIDALA